jgi:signal transduction histidine kinase
MTGLRQGLQRRIVLACTALAVLVGAAFALLIVTAGNLRSELASARHSEQVIATANQLQELVLELQTGARGYVINRDPVLLAPWESARRRYPAVAARLVELTRGEPAEERRARSLSTGVRTYETKWSRRLVDTARRDPAAARALVAGGEGKKLADRLRAGFQGLINAQHLRSDRSRSRADRQATYAIVSGEVGLVGSLFLIGAFGTYVMRRVVGPINLVVLATRRLAAGGRAARVPLSREDDEIAELAQSFNAMAQAIELQRSELEGRNRELERLATVLRAVLDSGVDGILVTDLAGNVQLSNRPLEQFVAELGISREGTAVDRLLSLKDKVRDEERYVATLERLAGRPDETSAHEFELLDPPRVFVSFTSPVRGEDGGLIGRLWTLREVTQERELHRLKDEFVASVSHELRTPLTSLMGFLEMVREDDVGTLTPQQERFLSIAQRSSERLERLVGDLLFVARLDARGMKLQPADIRLDEIVGEAIATAAPLAHSRQIDLRSETSADGGIHLRADPERVAQLAANLISNALKFTPEGGRVTARTFLDDGQAVLEVEDTGIGIPAADQERLFQRFFRSASATEQAIPGTGLGLVISKAIAEAHGGTISVRSAPGEGACFRVELPL